MTQNSPQVKQPKNPPPSRREVYQEKVRRFSEIAKDTSATYLEACATDDITASLMAGQAMARLQSAFGPEILDMIRPLANTQNGFKTDRGPGSNKPPYDDRVLAECCLGAILRGVQFVGNQFNIIAGQCYITREGYEYLIKRFPGFQWIKPEAGTAKELNGGYIIPMKAEWSVRGVKDSMESEIQVRKDSYSTIDQALGKAHRKFFKRVYERITGRVDYGPDETDATIIDNEAPQETPNADRKAIEPGRPAAEPDRSNDGAQGQDDKRPGDGVPAGKRQELGGDKGRPGGIPENFGRTNPQVGHPRH